MVSDPEWHYPIRKLAGNINRELSRLLKGREASFRHFSKESCSKLLSSRINFCDEYGWRGATLCEYNENTKEVTVSESFLQMVWLLCYASLIVEDNRTSEYYYRQFGGIIDTIKEKIWLTVCMNNWPSKVPLEGKYVFYLTKAYENHKYQKAIELALRIKSKAPIDDNTAKELDSLYEENEMVFLVNNLYLNSVCFYLLHEYGHFMMEGKNLDAILEEYKADAIAKQIILSRSDKMTIRSKMYGMTAGLCCIMFFMLKNPTHPDTDLRIQTVIDALPSTVEFRKKNAGLILSFIDVVAKIKGYPDYPQRTEDNIESLYRVFDYLEALKNNE